MAWILMIIVLALVFAPLLGWVLALYIAYKTHKSTTKGSIEKKSIYIVLTLVAILPFHSFIAYPLMIQECKSNGGEKIFSDEKEIPKNIVIDGDFYNIRDRYPEADLLLNETINSIYYTRRSYFGEGTTIRSRAENYTDNPFSLRAAAPSDVACGPFYQYAKNNEIKYHSNNPKERCIAYEQIDRPNSYLRIRKIENPERTFRTAWRAVEWVNTTYDIVENNSVKKIGEIREFNYKGYTYPMFLNYFSLASYSCRAMTDTYITLRKILNANNQEEPIQKTSKQDAEDRMNALQNAYFGFELPKEVRKYSIMLFDNDNFSSMNNPLKINITLPKSELPILVELYTNKFAEWNIINLENENVIVNLRNPLKENKVTGIDSSRVIETTTAALDENYLLKFYSGYFTSLHFSSTKNNNYFSFNVRATNIETNINIPIFAKTKKPMEFN